MERVNKSGCHFSGSGAMELLHRYSTDIHRKLYVEKQTTFFLGVISLVHIHVSPLLSFYALIYIFSSCCFFSLQCWCCERFPIVHRCSRRIQLVYMARVFYLHINYVGKASSFLCWPFLFSYLIWSQCAR